MPEGHKTRLANIFGDLSLARQALGIIHVADVYVVFGLRRRKFLFELTPGYLGTRDEKCGVALPHGIQNGRRWRAVQRSKLFADLFT